MILSRLIAFGFLGSVFAMFRFGKYCRLLNGGGSLEPEEMERYQAGARRWLAAMGILLGTAVLSILVAAVTQ